MRKILFYLLALIIVCFSIPILFTNRKSIQEVSSEINTNNQIVENKYDYKDYQTIKLLHVASNEIE